MGGGREGEVASIIKLVWCGGGVAGCGCVVLSPVCCVVLSPVCCVLCVVLRPNDPSYKHSESSLKRVPKFFFSCFRLSLVVAPSVIVSFIFFCYFSCLVVFCLYSRFPLPFRMII